LRDVRARVKSARISFASTVSTSSSLALRLRESPMRRREVIAVEAHDRDEHVAGYREVIRSRGSPPRLAALGAIERSHGSRYAALLQ
jgi:hypothetical protein